MGYSINALLDPLSFGLSVTISIFIIGINFGLSFLYMKYLKCYYLRTQSPVATLARYHMYSKYVQGVLSICSIIIILLLLLSPFSVEVREYRLASRIIILLGAFVLAAVIAVGNRIFFHSLICKISNTHESLIDFAQQIIRYYGYTFGIMCIFLVIFTFEQTVLVQVLSDNVLVETICYVLAYIAVSMVLPFAYQGILKASRLSSNDLSYSISCFIQDATHKKVALYQWSTRNKRQAQALVMNFFGVKIFLSDYLLEHFSKEEVNAIIGHELGHIQKRHLWHRRVAILSVVIFFYLLTSLMDVYKVPIGWGFLLLFLCGVGVAALVLLLWRIQEREADRYVLDIGVEPDVLVSALQKLAVLNDSPFKLSLLEEKFQTHPSFENRIRWIREKANGNTNKLPNRR